VLSVGVEIVHLQKMDALNVRAMRYAKEIGGVKVWHTEGRSPFCLQKPVYKDSIWYHGGLSRQKYCDHLHYMNAMHWLSWEEVDDPWQKLMVRPPQVFNKLTHRRGVAYGEKSWLKEVQLGSLSWYWFLQMQGKSGR